MSNEEILEEILYISREEGTYDELMSLVSEKLKDPRNHKVRQIEIYESAFYQMRKGNL